MDICVLSERDVSHSGVLLRARPIGGLRMIDGNEADDKIIAVLAGDLAYGHLERRRASFRRASLDRFRHYFLTYKQMPGEKRPVEIPEVYDRAEAQEMVRRSQADYASQFGASLGAGERLLAVAARVHGDHGRGALTGSLDAARCAGPGPTARPRWSAPRRACAVRRIGLAPVRRAHLDGVVERMSPRRAHSGRPFRRRRPPARRPGAPGARARAAPSRSGSGCRAAPRR